MAMGEFLQSFYCEASPDVRCAMLMDEPPQLGDACYDALVGVIAEYLFKRWAPAMPSPAEFKSRNVMTDEAPLRRAAAAKMREAG